MGLFDPPSPGGEKKNHAWAGALHGGQDTSSGTVGVVARSSQALLKLRSCVHGFARLRVINEPISVQAFPFVPTARRQTDP